MEQELRELRIAFSVLAEQLRVQNETMAAKDAQIAVLTEQVALPQAWRRTRCRKRSQASEENRRKERSAASWKGSRIAKQIFSDSQPTGVFLTPTMMPNRQFGSQGSRRKCPAALEPKKVLKDLLVC